tara:strand:+ start:369 stop:935 length:567 start_codon:yes stop_codon:yes gene_type:complete
MDYTMNLPNMITIFRLLLTPYIVWLILSESYFLGFLFFVISGISDGLDGFIAKKLNQKTLLGSYLDPIADKFLIVSSIVLLGYNGYVPIWLIIIIVSRDIAILGAVIISWMLDTNLKIEPLIVSKINTFLQIFYITLTFATVLNTNYLINFQNIAFIVTTYLIAFTTIVSWLSYLRIWLLNMNVINNE